MKQLRKTIMVIDDSPIEMKFLLHDLSKLNVDTIACQSSQEALELLRSGLHSIDLIIQDHVRPGINGLEFLQALNNDPLLSALPIFLLTAGFAKDSDRECYEAMKIPIFNKPIHGDSFLFDAVVNVLKLNTAEASYQKETP